MSLALLYQCTAFYILLSAFDQLVPCEKRQFLDVLLQKYLYTLPPKIPELSQYHL